MRTITCPSSGGCSPWRGACIVPKSVSHGEGSVTGPGNRLQSDGEWTYTYDAFGNRVRRAEYDGALSVVSDERYAVDGWRPGGGFRGNENFDARADVDANGNLVMRRLYGDGFDAVTARLDASGSAAWYLPDHLGSVRLVVDHTGTALGAAEYTAFGEVLGGSPSGYPTGVDRYGYAGREYDPATGLYHYRARGYDPSTGRFGSEDPLGTDADVNLYRYVGNSPANATDPSGMYVIAENADAARQVAQFLRGVYGYRVATVPIGGDRYYIHLYSGQDTSEIDALSAVPYSSLRHANGALLKALTDPNYHADFREGVSWHGSTSLDELELYRVVLAQERLESLVRGADDRAAEGPQERLPRLLRLDRSVNRAPNGSFIEAVRRGDFAPFTGVLRYNGRFREIAEVRAELRDSLDHARGVPIRDPDLRGSLSLRWEGPDLCELLPAFEADPMSARRYHLTRAELDFLYTLRADRWAEVRAPRGRAGVPVGLEGALAGGLILPLEEALRRDIIAGIRWNQQVREEQFGFLVLLTGFGFGAVGGGVLAAAGGGLARTALISGAVGGAEAATLQGIEMALGLRREFDP